MELTVALKQLHQRPIAYYPCYADLTGSINAGILLSQILYWWSAVDGRSFDKTDAELREETRLSEAQFKTAKRHIKKLGFIGIELHGVPARTVYNIDTEGLIKALSNIPTSWEKTTQLSGRLEPTQLVENRPTSQEETDQLFQRLPRDYPEITQRERRARAKQNGTIYLPGEDQAKAPARTQGQPLPDPFVITDPMREWATRQWSTIDIDATTETWADEMRSRGATRVDWVAAWRSGLRKMIDEWGRGTKRTRQVKDWDQILEELESGERGNQTDDAAV